MPWLCGILVGVVEWLWGWWYCKNWGETVWVRIPSTAQSNEVAHYLIEIAQELDTKPRRLRVTFVVPYSEENDEEAQELSRYTITTWFKRLVINFKKLLLTRNKTNKSENGVFLDLSVEGDLIVSIEGQENSPVNLRNRWISDYPVPLLLGDLKQTEPQKTVLYFEPVSYNRFRVMRYIQLHLPIEAWLTVSGMATLGIMRLNVWIMALVFGLILGWLLIQITLQENLKRYLMASLRIKRQQLHDLLEDMLE